MEHRLLPLLVGGRTGVLATIKRDGRPQLANVGYVYDEDTRVIRVSVPSHTAKVRNLHRDPRASFHVTTEDQWKYVVAEGVAELTAVAADPRDDTVNELVEIYRTLAGEHPDWDEFRAAMITERRVVLHLAVERVYGMA